MRTEVPELSDFQRRVLEVPEAYDLFLGGGRGGGKSFTLAVLALRHAEQYGGRARVLYLRQSFPGVTDFEHLTRQLFWSVYGRAASYNGSTHLWQLPTGTYLELGMLGDAGDYSRYQGRTFSLLLVDEAQQFPEPTWLDLLRSNLRGPRGVPVRTVLAANPGGVGNAWLCQRFVFTEAADWEHFLEPRTGRTWVRCPSVFRDNPFLDAESYEEQLVAATATDAGLREAWLSGDWTAVTTGAFFQSVLSAQNLVEPWPTPEEEPDWWAARGRDWELELAYDHGSTAPAVCLVVGRSPGGHGPDGRHYSRGSLVVLDELATNEPGSLTRGLGWVVPKVAEAVVELCERWRAEPQGAADDAIFAEHGASAGSVAEEFRRCRVRFRPAGKGQRVHGWEKLRRLLSDAGKPDVPGLYLARNCEYLWATLPHLGRDPRRPDDVDSRGPDHGADALRYALTAERRAVSYFGPVFGRDPFSELGL